MPAWSRDGKDVHLHASELVPGDVLILAEGDNVSADARVVEEYGLRVNNATLTGEAVPARKTADPSLPSGASDLERPNLIFAGTTVVSGTGRAVVYATGMLTQFGRIAHLTQTVKEEPTPFHEELARLSRTTTWVALGIGAIVAVVGYFQLQMKVAELILAYAGHRCGCHPGRFAGHFDSFPGDGCSAACAAQRSWQRSCLSWKRWDRSL